MMSEKKNFNLSVDEIIEAVTEICRKNEVEHLSLFGSYARGTQTEKSDIVWIRKSDKTLRNGD